MTLINLEMRAGNLLLRFPLAVQHRVLVPRHNLTKFSSSLSSLNNNLGLATIKREVDNAHQLAYITRVDLY
jgi:hypothetical protein